tara:strand:+ start:51 stop:572 length:522 start_codon:yes stop_codon:yes gene_type:complete
MKKYLLILILIVPIAGFTQKCKTKYKNSSANIEICRNGKWKFIEIRNAIGISSNLYNNHVKIKYHIAKDTTILNTDSTSRGACEYYTKNTLSFSIDSSSKVLQKCFTKIQNVNGYYTITQIKPEEFKRKYIYYFHCVFYYKNRYYWVNVSYYNKSVDKGKEEFEKILNAINLI